MCKCKVLIHSYSILQLESKVYNNELEEASFAEKLTSLNHRLQRMLSLLEIQVHLAQCLDLKERTSLQFYHLASCFSLKDIKGSDSLIHAANVTNSTS